MTAIGAGYDLSVAEYSPDGQIFQIEYAQKAVNDSNTILAICNKKTVLFASTKPIKSKLHTANSNKFIHQIDRHVAMCICGLLPDGAALVNQARKESKGYKDYYNHAIPIAVLQNRMAQYIHAHTRHSMVRPFGCNIVIGGFDVFEGTQIYMINTGGVSYGYHGCAAGKGRQSCRTEIEKLKLSKNNGTQMTVNDMVEKATKIILLSHEESKDNSKIDIELATIDAADNYKEIASEVKKLAWEKAEKELQESDEESDDE